jgi:hypothetical protein
MLRVERITIRSGVLVFKTPLMYGSKSLLGFTVTCLLRGAPRDSANELT